VCDTGHHRLLAWKQTPARDHVPADLVIGQPDFTREGRNGCGAAGAASLHVPTGVAAENDVLAVADAWNHRVLIWHGLPHRSNQPADVVLGQADFHSAHANRGGPSPTAATLNWCYGVAIHNGRLYVADTGNRRVLAWERIPSHCGVPADLVLGQRDFATRDEGAAEPMGAVGMRWPHAVACAGEMLVVADAGSSRVMVWSRPPQCNGAACDFVLGQPGPEHAGHNRGEYAASAASMNMPSGVATGPGQLIVTDTANSRLLGFDLDGLHMGGAATALAGQGAFAERGENRWRPAARDSLCWPYGVSVCGDTVVVADSGNNRVLLWATA
jgi:hypothetical protein